MNVPLIGGGVCPHAERARTRGFTLVDAIGLIGALGILAAVVAPAIPLSKQKQAIAIDFNNMRRLSMACQLYALDHNDYEPAPGSVTTLPSWVYGPALPTTVRTNQLASLEGSQLWPYLKDAKVFLCPTDSTNTPTWGSRLLQTSSYVMNGAVDGYQTLKAGRSYKSAQFASDRVVFWEPDPKMPFYFNDGSNYPDEGIGSSHQGGAVMGDFGGRAEFVSVRTFYGPTMAGSPGTGGTMVPRANLPNRLWCNPGDPFGL